MKDITADVLIVHSVECVSLTYMTQTGMIVLKVGKNSFASRCHITGPRATLVAHLSGSTDDDWLVMFGLIFLTFCISVYYLQTC